MPSQGLASAKVINSFTSQVSKSSYKGKTIGHKSSRLVVKERNLGATDKQADYFVDREAKISRGELYDSLNEPSVDRQSLKQMHSTFRETNRSFSR